MDLKILQTPADGHCLMHAIINSWQSQSSHRPVPSIHALKCDIFTESIIGCDKYLPFLNGINKFAYVRLVKNYILHKHYDNCYGDILPLIISNALSICILINDHQSNGITHIRQILPSSNSHSLSINIYRQNDHYSAMSYTQTFEVSREQSSPKLNEHPEATKSDRPTASGIKKYTKDELLNLRKCEKVPRTLRKKLFEHKLWLPKNNRLAHRQQTWPMGSQNSLQDYVHHRQQPRPMVDMSNHLDVYHQDEQTTANWYRHRQQPRPMADPIVKNRHDEVDVLHRNTTTKQRSHCLKTRGPGINDHNLVKILPHPKCHHDHLLTFCLLNARSAKQQDRINNKPMEIHDLIIDNNIDILALTETWFRNDGQDQVAIGDMTPPGYRIQHLPRPNKRGGGLAIIYRTVLEMESIKPTNFKTFECFTTSVKHSKASFQLAIVYRPPQTSTPDFLEEFAELIENLSIHTNHLIAGDFNFPVNVADHTDANKLISLLDCSNYTQHVNAATHENGHTLDLILSPTSSKLHPTVTAFNNSVSSDHYAVISSLRVEKPKCYKKSISVRKWRSIDVSVFNSEIIKAGPTNSVRAYNDLLTALIDKFAPAKTITITERPSTPWYTQDIRHAKTICRTLERKWKKSKLSIDHQNFKIQRNRLKWLREKSKRTYIQEKLTTASSPKDTYHILNSLLHKSSEPQFPPHQNTTELADRFATFFTEKIAAVRLNFDTNSVNQPSIINKDLAQLQAFQQVTEAEVKKLVSKSPTKSCSLDPAPTWLVKSCPGAVHLLCNIINRSLDSGIVEA